MGPIPDIMIDMPDVLVPSPRAPLTARGRATRERILAAAAALIHRDGVTGTSLDDVRAATGASKSQLYHYFRDKSALVNEVIERQVELVLAAQEPALSAADSMAGLRRWRDRVVEINTRPEAHGCPLGRLAGELAETDPAARAALAAGFLRWQQRLAAGLTAMHQRGELDGDPDTLAEALLAALQGGILLARTSGSVASLEAALDLAIDGIRGHLTDGQRSGHY